MVIVEADGLSAAEQDAAISEMMFEEVPENEAPWAVAESKATVGFAPQMR